MPIGPRVLTTLSAAGRIVRASNNGGWTLSRPRWASMADWLGEELDPPPDSEGVAGLVAGWLRAFGPGTAADIKWWLGSTVSAVRRALAELEAVEVDLDGQTGYLLPDDLEPTDPVEPWAALLPPLDPATMGWFERDWYLGDYKAQLFDTAGNGGPTVWWNGRMVGGWRQRESGEVELQMLEDVGADGRRAIESEAARLNEWLGGVRVLPRFPSPLSRQRAEV
jgi:Winged helix DNA-binding domain